MDDTPRLVGLFRPPFESTGLIGAAALAAAASLASLSFSIIAAAIPPGTWLMVPVGVVTVMSP